jgi:hypothetical protein
MKPAHGNRQPGLAKRPGEIKGTRVLVGLNADKGDEPEVAVALEPVQKSGDVDAGVDLIDRHDIDINPGAEDFPLGTIDSDAVDGGQGVRRDHRSPPADNISVIVVVGRLDKNELKPSVFSVARFCHYSLRSKRIVEVSVRCNRATGTNLKPAACKHQSRPDTNQFGKLPDPATEIRRVGLTRRDSRPGMDCRLDRIGRLKTSAGHSNNVKQVSHEEAVTKKAAHRPPFSSMPRSERINPCER